MAKIASASAHGKTHATEEDLLRTDWLVDRNAATFPSWLEQTVMPSQAMAHRLAKRHMCVLGQDFPSFHPQTLSLSSSSNTVCPTYAVT